MKSDTQNLQDAITPSTLGVIWITTDPLNKNPRSFEAFDYFLDGLLTNFNQQKNNDTPTNKKNFFISTNFGNPFFVGHLEESSKSFQEDLNDLVNLAKSMNEPQKTILLLDYSTKNHFSLLTKKFPSFNFEEISF